MEPVPLRDELDAVLRASTMLATLGITLEEWGPGSARTRLTPGSDLLNLAGTVHGGVVVSLADAAFEAACNGYGRMCVALQVSTHFASAAQPGEELVAEAREVDAGATDRVV